MVFRLFKLSFVKVRSVSSWKLVGSGRSFCVGSFYTWPCKDPRFSQSDRAFPFVTFAFFWGGQIRVSLKCMFKTITSLKVTMKWYFIPENNPYLEGNIIFQTFLFGFHLEFLDFQKWFLGLSLLQAIDNEISLSIERCRSYPICGNLPCLYSYLHIYIYISIYTVNIDLYIPIFIDIFVFIYLYYL